MTFEEIESVLKTVHTGEIIGLNTIKRLMNQALVFSEKDQKNYIDGDVLLKLVNERKKLLCDRITKYSEDYNI